MAEPSSFFFADARADSPLSYEALQSRRRIAEALLGKRSPFPKNIGEGLTYLGESLSDRWMQNELDKQEKASLAAQAGLLEPPGMRGTFATDTPSGGILTGGSGEAVAPLPEPAGRYPATVGPGDTRTTSPGPLDYNPRSTHLPSPPWPVARPVRKRRRSIPTMCSRARTSRAWAAFSLPPASRVPWCEGRRKPSYPISSGYRRASLRRRQFHRLPSRR